MTNSPTTYVSGQEEIETTQIKRTKRFLLFFKTEWWETVNAKHIGNDIYINTDRPIRNVYINGKLILSI